MAPPPALAQITQTTTQHSDPGVLIWVPLSNLQHHVQLEHQLEMEHEHQKQQQQQIQQQIEQERMQLSHLITLQHHLELQQHLQEMQHQVPLENQDAFVQPGGNLGGGVIAGGIFGGAGDTIYSPLPHDDILARGVGPGPMMPVPPPTIHHTEITNDLGGMVPQVVPVSPEIMAHHPQIHPHLSMMIPELLLRQHHMLTNELGGDVILTPPQVQVPPESLTQQRTYPEEGMGVQQMIHQIEPPIPLPHHVLGPVEALQVAEAMMMTSPTTTTTTTTTTQRPPTVLREVNIPATTPSTPTIPPSPSPTTTTTGTPSTTVQSPSSSSVKPSVLKEASNDVAGLNKL